MLTSFIIGVLLLYGVCGWLHLRKTRTNIIVRPDPTTEAPLLRRDKPQHWAGQLSRWEGLN
jgi:hypothetical protein